MAQGGAAKGGGGKGKGAEEREEECSICQSEFTVRGDGGECFEIVYHIGEMIQLFHSYDVSRDIVMSC